MRALVTPWVTAGAADGIVATSTVAHGHPPPPAAHRYTGPEAQPDLALVGPRMSGHDNESAEVAGPAGSRVTLVGSGRERERAKVILLPAFRSDSSWIYGARRTGLLPQPTRWCH